LYLIDFVEVLITECLHIFFILYVVKLVLTEKSRVEDERKMEELTHKLEEALALRQEAEAKLAHAEKKLCELEHLPGNFKVSQFCSYHYIMSVLCIFCMFVHILHPVIMLTNCGSVECMCVYVLIIITTTTNDCPCLEVFILLVDWGCTDHKTSKYHVCVNAMPYFFMSFTRWYPKFSGLML